MRKGNRPIDVMLFLGSYFGCGAASLVARRATYVVDGWFFGHFFGRWKGQCAHMLIPVWLTCGSESSENFNLVIFGHIGSHEW